MLLISWRLGVSVGSYNMTACHTFHNNHRASSHFPTLLWCCFLFFGCVSPKHVTSTFQASFVLTFHSPVEFFITNDVQYYTQTSVFQVLVYVIEKQTRCWWSINNFLIGGTPDDPKIQKICESTESIIQRSENIWVKRVDNSSLCYLVVLYSESSK